MTTLQSRPRVPLAPLLLIFFATGISGLVYQVAWQRYLLNIFGATIYSVSTVLAAFMGGLALGSWIFGGIAERVRRHLLLYGVLEILIGGAALAIPYFLRALDPVFIATYRGIGSSFVAYSLVRFALVFLVLLVPTTMMGGTLPLLSKFVSPLGQRAGVRVGGLYALNTFGAVTGTILSGFFLIRWWGISSTVMLAAGINAIAGAVAILLGRTPTQDAPPALLAPLASSPQRGTYTRPVMWAYFISGFAALGLEVVWSRALVFTFDHLKNTTYSFTAMLAVFLIGVAIGSAVMSLVIERQREPFRVFSALQVLIGLSAIFSFYVMYYHAYTLGDEWAGSMSKSPGNIRWNAAMALVFLRTAATMLLPTFCMGLAFPVAVRALLSGMRGTTDENNPHTGRMVGRLYAVNTLGAILGSFLTGFFFLPLLGIAKSIFFLGAVQLVTGLVLITRWGNLSRPMRIVWVGVAIAVAVLAFPRKPAIFQSLGPLEKIVFYKEGPLATASVVENSLRYRTIYVDNVGVAGTDPMLLTDQKSLAHVPVLLLKNPKSALTVGFGSGGASYSYTLYPELERVDCVEITKTVIEAAPTLVASNHDVVMYAPEFRARTGQAPPGPPLWNDGGASGWYKRDPRFNVVLEDVRSYLRFTNHRYDIIATDCTDLRYKSNANLYDLEYFQLTRDRITSDGMVVVWMPLAGLSDDAFRVALRTFYRVFPTMEVFYMNNQPTHYILLLGTREPLKVDPKQIAERLRLPEIARDLGELHLASAEKILSCFITGRDAVKEYLAGDVLNTEDFPYIEFESPRYGYGDMPLLQNLDALMKRREDPARLLAEGTDSEFRQRLQRYYDAVPAIIRGHWEYRMLNVREATSAYMEALRANPDDPSVHNLLNLDELRRKVQGQPGNIWAREELGMSLAMQKRDSEAIAELELLLQYSVSASDPDAPERKRRVMTELANIYERNNKTEKAGQYRQQASQALTQDSAW